MRSGSHERSSFSGTLPALGFDGRGELPFRRDQIELGGEAEEIGRKRNRARDRERFIPDGHRIRVHRTRRGGFGQKMIQRIHPPMRVPALDREFIVRPAPLDMHEMEEPGAIRILVEHAQGEEVGRGWGSLGHRYTERAGVKFRNFPVVMRCD